MTKIKTFFKSLDYRHYICVVITLVFVCLTAFVYRTSFLRLIESIVDFATSIFGYFCNLIFLGNENFDIDSVTTVTNPSGVTYPVQNNFDQFVIDFKRYWDLWANETVFYGYLALILQFLMYFTTFIMLIVSLVLLSKFIFKQVLYRHNDYVGAETAFLRGWKRFSSGVYLPVKKYLSDFVSFLKTYSFYLKIWLFVWLVNTNIVSIVVSAVAFVFYFSSSFSIAAVPHQCYKLFLDLTLMFDTLPWLVWVIVGVLLFDMWRKRFADMRLRHFEAVCRAFLNNMGVCVMINGEMGKGKTKLLTDMVLSQRVIFRDKALEILQKIDMQYPNFPWLTFETDLRRGFDDGSLYNLASIERYVIARSIQSECIINDEGSCNKSIIRYMKKHRTALFKPYWGYDYRIYPRFYNDSLKISLLERDLITYAHAYFIYTCSNYVLSNYSIRFDDVMLTSGNFPRWNTDFLERDPKTVGRFSRYAKILDQDMLRLGKNVIKDNPHAGTLEFGIIAMTEIGKERLNQLEQQGLKKSSEEANQKNDLFNYTQKFGRHPSTVDNYPFFRFFADEQRAMSLGADLRELCTLVDIDTCSDLKITIPFFGIEDFVISRIYKRFMSIYLNFRFYRGDNSLFMYSLKNFVVWLNNYRQRRFNRYGYMKMKLEVEKGNMEGATDSYFYYLMTKKIYSERYSTDCYAGYFRERAFETKLGFKDIAEYEGVKATADELREQNSYFVKTLEENVSKKRDQI